MAINLEASTVTGETAAASVASYERPCCDVCGSKSATLVTDYDTRSWPLVSCDACGFLYLRRVPKYEALNTQMAWEKSHAQEKKRRNTRKWAAFDNVTRFRLKAGKIVDRARHTRAFAEGERVLELGCGGGTRIPEGAVPYGIEISQGLADRARPIFESRGGQLIHGAATEGIEHFNDGFFDAIIMRSYLEHEPAPRQVLERAFAKLKPGGRIMLRLPNFSSLNRHLMRGEWCGFRFPDHVNYFTPRSLKALGESIGYEFRWRNWYSIFDDNIIAVLQKPAGSTRSIAKAS